MSIPASGADPSAEDRSQFEELYQRAPFGYLITDAEDVILRVNETLLTWSGYAEHEVIGRPFRDLLTSGAQILYETRHIPVLHLQGFSHEVSLQLVKADASLLPVLINASITTNGDGRPAEVRIGVLDASSRISWERELLTAQRTAESLADRVSVLQNASSAFASSSTETQITDQLASILENALVASATCVALIDSSGELEVIAGTNLLDGLIREDGLRPADTVLAFEKPVFVGTTPEDEASYPSMVAGLRTARLRTVALFPIMSDARPIGIAAAFFGRERTLAANEVDVVLSVARQASQVLTRLRAQTQLAHLALHDQLTGLANRSLIRESISVDLAHAARSSKPFSLLFIDLDGFKKVNDELGHHIGDAILRAVAQRLTASVRESDVVGRYGGDEFVVICRDTDSQDASAISSRIRAAVRAAFDVAEGFDISASIGIATHQPGAASASMDEIINAADAAMYESKRLGRDRTTQVQV